MSKTSLALLIALLTPAATFAIPVTGTSTGIFVNPAGPPGMVTTGVGTNNFSWGFPTPPSRLMFHGSNVESTVGDAFSLGTLVFTNNVINVGTEARSVELDATLMLTLPGVGTHMLELPLLLVNTLNTGSDPDSPDFVIFPVSVPPQVFSADGTRFSFEFLGFGTMSQGGGLNIVPFISAAEGRGRVVNLFGRVTTPEPATLALLGLGLLAVAAGRRSRMP